MSNRLGIANALRFLVLGSVLLSPAFGVPHQMGTQGALDLTLTGIRGFKAGHLVEYAELDYVARASNFRTHRADSVGQYAWQNRALFAPLCTPDDPHYADQWALSKIDAPEAWDITTGSVGITIAIVDSGLDLNHPDLKNKVWTNANEIPDNGVDDDGNGYVDDTRGWDFVNGDNDPQDDYGHGTHVAGIAAAETSNGDGIAGVSWGAKLLPVKVLNEGGEGHLPQLAEGIRYAADNGAKIINLSLGTSVDSSVLREAVDYAYSKGCVLVAQVGDRNGPVDYPAKYHRVIGVAATDQNDQRASFSNYGLEVEIAAPGKDIKGTLLGGGYGWWSSTGLAAAHVAGLASLIWSYNPTLTAVQVRNVIRLFAVDLGSPGRDPYYGRGRIDAYAALTEGTYHYLEVIPTSLLFVADDNTGPPPQIIVNPGTTSLTWDATGAAPWLSITAPFGCTPSYATVSVDKDALPGYATYTAPITVTSTLPGAQNSPLVVDVTFTYLQKTYVPLIFKNAD